MDIFFDVKHLYYLPQYLPVFVELKKRGVNCSFVFYTEEGDILTEICESVIEQQKLKAYWCDDWEQALSLYQNKAADWVIFGNVVRDIDKIHAVSKTALMQHGIGPKQCYYDVSENLTTVRFVEGAHRLNRLNNIYPKGNFVDVGYAKLDPLFNGSELKLNLLDLRLDPNKQTLLYAPTFYPSSIECFADSFAEDFSDFNLIIKPHHFSLIGAKYSKQRQLLEKWQKFENVYLASVADYNLLPFMLTADVMLSDASSAIFEFAALNKPVVWCDFYKLRWSYRGVLSFRFKKRMDSDISYFHKITDRAERYQLVKNTVIKVLENPQEKSEIRSSVIERLAGKMDGKVSARIASYLEGK